MRALQDLGIQDLFFLVLRLIAATGGFIVGYLVTGPTARGLFRLAFHREMPRWSATFVKIVGGLAVAVVIFLCLPLGWGGGGGGSGGGTGSGKGPFAGDQGNGPTALPGKAANLGPGPGNTGKEKTAAGADTLAIELLGPTTAEGDRYYNIQRQGPPVNFAAVEAFWEQTHARWARVEIVLTRTSTSENDPAVDRLRKLVRNADDNQKRTVAIVDESNK
jgi:hypothetical protein